VSDIKSQQAQNKQDRDVAKPSYLLSLPSAHHPLIGQHVALLMKNDLVKTQPHTSGGRAQEIIRTLAYTTAFKLSGTLETY